MEEKRFETPAKGRVRKSLATLNIPPSPFLERLGYGTGVNVWKLQPSPKHKSTSSPWAIKNVRKNMEKSTSQMYQSLLLKEAKILESLNHENIIGYRGVLKASDGRKCLAMEIGGDSLGNMIENRLEDDLGPFPAKDILKVAFNVAKALKYLHSEKHILHGDIKSYNIVIKGDFDVIKLCDFGVSVKLDENGMAQGFVGTPAYSAPECQENAEGPVTAKSDIFSLGLVLWEMIALCPPHTQVEDFESCEDDNDDSVVILEDSFEESFFAEKAKNFGTRPPLPPVDLTPEYQPVLEVFYCCTEAEPDKRPSAEYLVQHLQQLVQ